ncbi:hypothetical protein G7Y89_g13857 [Cudoniella acicularis]|uniref:3-beta hydroxysteroid dehydrogenase/isomerase domain-containing protein n=1 Tax=Cudoniella acicularis TaxID=354080 RepID=A0A8H4R7R5_9HELO|nr:hypothetical protein G7Y89_g13857 [Cudoniella acicularis]
MRGFKSAEDFVEEVFRFFGNRIQRLILVQVVKGTNRMEQAYWANAGAPRKEDEINVILKKYSEEDPTLISVTRHGKVYMSESFWQAGGWLPSLLAQHLLKINEIFDVSLETLPNLEHIEVNLEVRGWEIEKFNCKLAPWQSKGVASDDMTGSFAKSLALYVKLSYICGHYLHLPSMLCFARPSKFSSKAAQASGKPLLAGRFDSRGICSPPRSSTYIRQANMADNSSYSVDLNPIPAGESPPGWKGLYTGPELHTVTLVMVCILAPIACVAVAGRLISNYKTREAQVVGLFWQIRTYAQHTIAWPAVILAKPSILLLYFRIFNVRPAMRYAIYGGKSWGLAIGIRCGTKGPLKWLVVSAIMSLALDLYILLLPITTMLPLPVFAPCLPLFIVSVYCKRQTIYGSALSFGSANPCFRGILSGFEKNEMLNGLESDENRRPRLAPATNGPICRVAAKKGTMSMFLTTQCIDLPLPPPHATNPFATDPSAQAFCSMNVDQISSVLVTGGGGYLGSHIVRQLLDNSPRTMVTCVSRNPQSGIQDSRAIYKAADITSEDEVKALFLEIKPQVIIHTVSPSQDDWPAVLQHTNIDGTRALLSSATASPETRAFVFTGSNSAIVSTQTLLTETDSEFYTSHRNAYARTKAEAEKMVLAANGPQLRTATLRLPAIYGENDHNFLPQLVKSIRKNEHRVQLGKNDKLWEFAYVGKAAEAHILAAKALLRESGPKVDGEAFFITDGKPQPFFDFARKAYTAASHSVAPEEVKKIPLRLVQTMASGGEWAYWLFTLNTKKPAMRRANIDQLSEGCHWSIEKARERLGYDPGNQDVYIKQSMDWAMANC